MLSGTANGIAMVAFPWLVLDVTGDATATGAISAVTALPLLAAMLFSGTLVDIAGRQRVSVISDVFSMLSVALVPILAASVGLDFGLLLLVAALGAVFDPAGVTAREAMLPEAAAASRVGLERVNGIHEAAYGLAFLLGPGMWARFGSRGASKEATAPRPPPCVKLSERRPCSPRASRPRALSCGT